MNLQMYFNKLIFQVHLFICLNKLILKTYGIYNTSVLLPNIGYNLRVSETGLFIKVRLELS